MFKFPYRPCLLCRSQLERFPEQETQDGWERYLCSHNCGSLVLVKPFAYPVIRKDDSASQEQVSK